MPSLPSVPPVLNTEGALEDHVRAERVRFVFIQSALPILFSPAGAVTLSYAVWDLTDHTRLTAWTAGLTVIALLRIVLVRAFPEKLPSPVRVKQWERTFVASIMVVDLWWGFGALFLLPATLVGHALVFSFLMLMAGGHSSSYAAHPATVVLGVLSLVLPITVHFGLIGDVAHRALAIAALMYLAATFRSIRTLGYFFGRSHRLAAEVQRERDRAEELARTDFLTGLQNRRAFYETGEAAVKHAQERERPAALMMLDIDHFKAINDKFGHAAGDAVICAVARLTLEEASGADVTGRLGGEEFAMLLPEASLEDAVLIAERLRLRVAGESLTHEGQSIRFTASFGVAAVGADEGLGALMARADAALYRAKQTGRNSVVPATRAAAAS